MSTQIAQPLSPAIPPVFLEGEILQIPLDQLHESPWNPRQYYPEAALAELIASMKESGFRPWLPLMVRPLPEDRWRSVGAEGPQYEIGAGHRRSRAAREAGLESVPCIVREMTDEQFLDVLNFDNCGREDVHPLHEAAGWRAWMEKTGGSVADIAARIGQSEEYVYQRLKYSALIEKAKQAFIDKKITPGHAILIARLTPDQQMKALEYSIPPEWDDPEDRPSVRMLNVWIQKTLRAAPPSNAAEGSVSSSAAVPASAADVPPPSPTRAQASAQPVELVCSSALLKELSESYSGDMISRGKVRKPVQFDADTTPYVAVGVEYKAGGGGPKSVECYEIYKLSEFDGEPTTYDARAAQGDVIREDIKGFYHGVRVTFSGQTYVLSGPPVVYVPDQKDVEARPNHQPAVAEQSQDVTARLHCERSVRLAIVNAIRKKIGLASPLAKWEIGDLIAMILDEPVSQSGIEEICQIHGVSFQVTGPFGAAFVALRRALPSLSHEEMMRLAIELTVVNDLDRASIAKNEPPEKLMEVARSYGVDAVRIRLDVERSIKNATGGTQREVKKAAPTKKPKRPAKKKAAAKAATKKKSAPKKASKR